MIVTVAGISLITATDYLEYYRDLVDQDAKDTSVQIGRPGIITEVDEPKFGKRGQGSSCKIFGSVERTKV